MKAGHVLKAEESLFLDHFVLLDGIILGHYADGIRALHEPEADIIHKDNVHAREVGTHHGLESDANVINGVQFPL